MNEGSRRKNGGMEGWNENEGRGREGKHNLTHLISRTSHSFYF